FVKCDECYGAYHSQQKDRPPPADHEVAEMDHHLRERWKLCAEAGKYLLKLRNDEHQQNRADENGNGDHGSRVKHRFLDLTFQRLKVLLVGGYCVQHRLENAGRLASSDQVAVQLVELHRVLSYSLAQRQAALHIGTNAVDQRLHLRVLVPATDNLERTNDRHTRLHHGGDLTAEDRDVQRRDTTPTAAEQWLRLCLNHLRRDALLAELGTNEVGVLRRLLALHRDTALVGAFPTEHGHRLSPADRRRSLGGRSGHGHRSVPWSVQVGGTRSSPLACSPAVARHCPTMPCSSISCYSRGG